MARSAHQQATSPLIRGGIFSQPTRKTARPKEEPRFLEILNDYKGLLDDLICTFTATVDNAFPNANFLAQQAGSYIPKDDMTEDAAENTTAVTKLSYVFHACFDLSPMKLNKNLVKNYQRTITEYLNKIKHDPSKAKQYTELHNVFNLYKHLEHALRHHHLISNELTRLNTLELQKNTGLSYKTTDRRLKTEWADTCIKKPIADVTAQVAETMRSSERFQSPELAGRSNSLASLVKLIDTSLSRKSENIGTIANPSGKMRLAQPQHATEDKLRITELKEKLGPNDQSLAAISPAA